MIFAIAALGIVILSLILIFIIKESLPALKSVGSEIFTSFDWYPTYDDAEYGLLTMIIDTFLLTALTSIVVIPLGCVVAAYLYAYAGSKEKEIIRSILDLLSGIPSVVIGLVVLIYIAPLLINFEIWSTENLFLTVAGLTILSLPYVVSLTYESFESVDRVLFESALALGSTRFSALFNVIARAAIPGILNAFILTVNRIIGETMVVLMVSGNANIIPKSLFDPLRTLTSAIASEMGEVELGSLHYSVLFVAGLILLVISLILTWVSKSIQRGWKH
ncbi:MAG: phosphate ABC transporter permease subunit PstC [Thermotogae bacterium]|nr:phosphate ABC transporter permease subunit PstC [Thermotogota bacterium]